MSTSNVVVGLACGLLACTFACSAADVDDDVMESEGAAATGSPEDAANTGRRSAQAKSNALDLREFVDAYADATGQDITPVSPPPKGVADALKLYVTGLDRARIKAFELARHYAVFSASAGTEGEDVDKIERIPFVQYMDKVIVFEGAAIVGQCRWATDKPLFDCKVVVESKIFGPLDAK
jgi:hypothetical protein